jgi:hypothetical protein
MQSDGGSESEPFQLTPVNKRKSKLFKESTSLLINTDLTVAGSEPATQPEWREECTRLQMYRVHYATCYVGVW